MTICAENFKISGVCPPIFDASRPCPRAVKWPNLRARVNVVQFQDADVINTAFEATPSKLGYDFTFDFPIAFLPAAIGGQSHALRTAVAIHGCFPALLAGAVAPPASSVAAARAKARHCKTVARRLHVEQSFAGHAGSMLSGGLSVRRQVGQTFVPSRRSLLPRTGYGAELSRGAACKAGMAVFAFVRDGFHVLILASREALATLFDIACERIRKAYAQPDMFVEQTKAPEPKQAALFGDAA